MWIETVIWSDWGKELEVEGKWEMLVDNALLQLLSLWAYLCYTLMYVQNCIKSSVLRRYVIVFIDGH